MSQRAMAAFSEELDQLGLRYSKGTIRADRGQHSFKLSLNAFMATLSQAEERLVSSWLLQKTPAATETVVEKWWQGICQGVVRCRLEIAKNRIKVSGLSAGEVVNLQKQILDLQGQLHEFPRPAGGADI